MSGAAGAGAAIWTVGHSSRSIEELVRILAGVPIRLLVDVRRMPRSRRYPHFDQGALRAALEGHGIVYHWAGAQLGGRRAPRPGSPHLALEEGLRGYADHMGTEAFARALDQLSRLAARGSLAILCAERDPERCHRSLLADALVLRGHPVTHLIDGASHRPHVLHPQLRVVEGVPAYDLMVSAPLELQ